MTRQMGEEIVFESIVFKSPVGPVPFDIGALAEGLLFYGRVAIVGNGATIKDVLSQIPPFTLLSLMQDDRIEFHYLEDQNGVATTQTANGRSRHDLVTFSSPQHTPENDGIEAFTVAAGGTGKARRAARRFAKLLHSLDHSGFDKESVLHALIDDPGIEGSVRQLIGVLVPDYPSSDVLRFRIEREPDGFYVDTNLDFARLNNLYHRIVPPTHSSLSEAYILSLLERAYETTYYAGALNSEVAVDSVERVIQAQTVQAVIRRYEQSESEVEKFLDLTLSDGNAIREAVNSGAVSFTSLVELLDSADEFRHWLGKQPPDASLIRAYYQETIKDSWVEKLPAKTIRWGVFTGLGVATGAMIAGVPGAVAGVALSTTDFLLVGRLAEGWKPHQFVEGDFKSLFGVPPA